MMQVTAPTKPAINAAESTVWYLKYGLSETTQFNFSMPINSSFLSENILSTTSQAAVITNANTISSYSFGLIMY